MKRLLALLCLIMLLTTPLAAYAEEGGLSFLELEKAHLGDVSREIVVRYTTVGNTFRTLGLAILEGVNANRSLGRAFDLVTLGIGADMNRVLSLLQSNPLIASAEPNFMLYIQGTSTPNDPFFSNQWALQSLKAPQAWASVSGIEAREIIIVAVIDTGVDTTHEDLQGRLVQGYNFILNNQNVNDAHGHGTSVTGGIVAATNNALGIAGVAGEMPVMVMPLQAGDSKGSMSFARMVEAVNYAIDKEVAIINISFGGSSSSSSMDAVIADALAAGIVVVASAGNAGTTDYMYPASYEGVISVGAINQDGVVASFSNKNDKVTVVAPGVGVHTTLTTINKDNKYGTMTGTSIAAPLVSGTVAMLLSIRPELTPDDVYDALISSAIPLGGSTYDNSYGYGLVDAHMLLLPGDLRGVVSYATLGNLPGDPIEEVSVHIKELAMTTTTDSYGAFSFADLPAGVYSLKFSISGYVEKHREGVSLYGNSDLVLNVSTALIGDINLDGHINAADIVPLNRHALGIQYITHPVALLAADVNGDGVVNAADIVPLNRHALGIERIH